MPQNHLATYLNDHLAGSITGIELLEHLETAHAGTELARFAAALRADVTADRRELETLMEHLEITPSAPRQALGWLADKATHLKLYVEDPGDGAFRLLETLEAIAVGIDGKRALWAALAAAASAAPELQLLDYSRLEGRAAEQRGRVEEARREAAKDALTITA